MRHIHSLKFVIAFMLLTCTMGKIYSQSLTLVSRSVTPSIVIDQTEDSLISITANLLANDIQLVTGKRPPIINSYANTSSPVIILGSLKSSVIRNLVSNSLVNISGLQNKWECYSHQFVTLPQGSEALVIIGSNNRGAAYGAFQLSEQIGVSPWYWWADVHINKKNTVTLSKINYTSKEPTVKYRGIFLNDEDWGLKPWAALTVEPSVATIGPKTYTRIFELLLRLKANAIWPAMHNVTTAFWKVSGNSLVAKKYDIVLGSSHAEPMLCNNVDEWNTTTMGEFNYATNSTNVQNYWINRAGQSAGQPSTYTVGMRGLHDGMMLGYSTTAARAIATTQIIQDQRTILKTYVNDTITKISQIFVPYKEVLDIYNQGFTLPDDVTLMWTDDNFGNVTRLNNETEATRSGGGGLYYHISYWGTPHDHLWLSSTHPMHIWEELTKTYKNNSKNYWIVNVGDIKPAEYNATLFLDMAYDITQFNTPDKVKTHFDNWHQNAFGNLANTLSPIMWEYYNLAVERKPEFMGWNQAEAPSKLALKRTEYNHFFYGDEAQKRINSYATLETKVKEIGKSMPDSLYDSFFQTVYYPVVCSSLMTKKILYSDKADFYSRFQNRLSGDDYYNLAKLAYDSIQLHTATYNNVIAKGKWKYMMNAAPRGLDVFKMPIVNTSIKVTPQAYAVMPEGYVRLDSTLFRTTRGRLSLPRFTSNGTPYRFVDIFLTKDSSIHWSASTSANWVYTTKTEGYLTSEIRSKENRLFVGIDWNKITDNLLHTAIVTIKVGDIETPIEVSAKKNGVLPTDKNVELDGIALIPAGNYTTATSVDSLRWLKIDGLGRTKNAMQSLPFHKYPLVSGSLDGKFPSLEYEYTTFSDSIKSITLNCTAVQPLNTTTKLQLAVSIDGLPYSIVDYYAQPFKDEQWKLNVLSNTASKTILVGKRATGHHKIKVYALDPTIILDNIEVNLGSTAQHYGIITPTDTLVWKPNLAVSGISISPATMAVIVGETGQLRAYLSPASATNTSVCWKSSNTAIATVSNNGLIAGIAAGAVTITATTVDGAKIDSAQVMVNLQNVNLSSFKINPSAIILAAGAEQQLNTEFSPSNANNTELTWSSNNPAIASVNERGFVTANGTGTAIITASTIEGKKTTSASVVVDKCSNYLYFNGVNQYVALPATVDNSIVLTNFTVEMWLNPSDTQNTNTFPIISNKDFSTGLNVGWALVHHGNGVFRFNMSNGTIRYDVTFTAPPRGVWSHLAIVVDRAASDVDIYINGVKRTLTRAYNLTALTATTGTVSTTLGLSLGQDGTGKYTRFWSGSMDELRIWNGTRTLQQIQNNQCKLNPINELNLIVYYNFNSFKRNVLYDLTEKANGLLLGMTDQNWLAAPICNNAGTLLDQTIAFAPFNDATTASPEISLQAISTSKLSIKYSSTDTTIASIRNNMLLIKKEGEVSITAAQSGNLVYNPATSVSQTLKVVAAAVAGIKTAKTVNSLVLYPNPAKNNFTIILDEGTLKQYRILSLNGLELKKQIKEVHVKESIIDVADLVTGTYILELVTTDNRIIHSKFSKI